MRKSRHGRLIAHLFVAGCSAGDHVLRTLHHNPRPDHAPSISTIAELGAYTTRDLVIGDQGHRRVIDATVAEWNSFEVTRTPPALGRGFRVDDQIPGAESVIVVSHWPRSSAIGRRIRLTGKGAATQWRTVVGVVSDVLMRNPLSRDRSALAI